MTHKPCDDCLAPTDCADMVTLEDGNDVCPSCELDDRRKHGSPYDRGGADSYYGRPYAPHYWPEGTYNGCLVPYEDMSTAQVKEYYTGYNDNEAAGNFKDWGDE